MIPSTSAEEPVRKAGPDKVLFSLASVILLDALSYSLVLPLLPFILKSYDAGAAVGGGLVAIHAVFATLAAPALGTLSDRIGRKPVILGTIVGTALSYVLFGFSRNLTLLFVARALSGAMAANSGVIHAAAADHSASRARAKAMGLLNAAVAMGFVLGPAVSAVIGQSGEAAARWVGLTAAGASCFAFAFVAAGFDEPPRGIRQKGGARWPFVAHSWTLQLLALVLVAAMSHAGLVSMTAFWGAYAYGWGAREVGYLFCWVSVFMVIAQIAIVPRLANRLGERLSLRVGLGLAVISLAALIVAPHSVPVLALGGPLLFCGITVVQTMCMSQLSRQVEANERGALMGIANGAASAGRIVGPALCGMLFVHLQPIAPYWLVAVALGGWLIWLSLGAAPVDQVPSSSRNVTAKTS
jgi:MFS family permease